LILDGCEIAYFNTVCYTLEGSTTTQQVTGVFITQNLNL